MQHDASDPISIPSPSASDCGPGGLPVDDYDADCSPSPPKDVENKEAEVEADVAEAESRAATVSRKRDVKNGQSYIAMIAKAILASPEKKLSLHGIYEYVAINYAQYKNKVGWRNSVRHNLSLNECFIKAGRCESGKGNYWAIHPANFDDFARGDFRRRHARNRVRKSRFQLPRVGPPPPSAIAAAAAAAAAAGTHGLAYSYPPPGGCWVYSFPSSLVSPISPVPMYAGALPLLPCPPSPAALLPPSTNHSNGEQHNGKFTGAGSPMEQANPQKKTFSISNLIH
ncbi:forkhead box protein D3-like [Oscarella lobularis]|uniref:forkhead box protein D3-like n=1 Tax=Oscarella lobularis TaxID=121494 RepID=UPI00331373EB